MKFSKAASRFSSIQTFGFLLLSLLICSFSSVVAQQTAEGDSLAAYDGDPQYYLGVFGGYSFLWHATELPIFSTLGDCGNFEDGTSQGFYAGASVDYILLPGLLQLSGRLMYDHRAVGLQTQCDNGLTAYDPGSDSYVPYIREHTYDGTLDYLVVDVGARVQPLATLPLYFRGSVDAGVALFGSDFLQEESIVQPEAVLFPDGLARHPTAEGEIDNLTTSYGASAAIGADFELQDGFSIHPEVGFRYGLNSLVNSAEWNVQMLRMGVGLRWRFHETKYKTVPRVPQNNKPPLEVVDRSVGIEDAVIVGINSEPLEVRETVVTQTIPLLPYIFFDAEDTELPRRYRPLVNRASFRSDSLPRETLTTYYHILHIIGKRMLDNPAARLTLLGTTDGKEVAEGEQLGLARKRAESVRNYLVREWGIDPERLEVRASKAPRLASSNEYEEGIEENRRVELSSDDPFLLGPVVHSQFSEYLPINSRQSFAVNLRNEHLADRWTLSVSYKDRAISTFAGEGAPAATLEMPLQREQMVKLGKDINARDSLDGELQIVDKLDRITGALCRFPIIRSREKFEVSRLSLIVFDFDRHAISSDNRVMMDEFVTAAVREGSRVQIVGSTDRLGEWDYNLELSEQRAQAVRSYLDEIEPDATLDSVRGTGAADLKFDNNLPEGRYYCRTVSLEVKTPYK